MAEVYLYFFPVAQSEPEEMPPEAKMRMKNIGRYRRLMHIQEALGNLNVTKYYYMEKKLLSV